MKLSKKRAAARKRVNKKNKILLIGHPTYGEWGEKMQKTMISRGSDVTSDFTAKNFSELISSIGKQSGSNKYTCIVLVPGHGCEATHFDPRSKLRLRSKPGLIWSENPTSTKRGHQLKGKNLGKVVNELLNITKHLHLCTCNQGSMLDYYDDIVNDARTVDEYIISGWMHAMTMHDRDVDKFIINGCHPFGDVPYEKFRFLQKKPFK